MWKAFALTLAFFLLLSAAKQDSIGVDNCSKQFRVNAKAFAERVL
jgi:hypothetical protein